MGGSGENGRKWEQQEVREVVKEIVKEIVKEVVKEVVKELVREKAGGGEGITFFAWPCRNTPVYHTAL